MGLTGGFGFSNVHTFILQNQIDYQSMKLMKLDEICIRRYTAQITGNV